MTSPWAVNPMSALIVGAPPRYRFIGSQIPAELLAWASGAGVTLYMVDIWYLDSTIPRYIWEAIGTLGATPMKIKGLYSSPTGVSVYQRDYITGGAQYTTDIGADSSLDSAQLVWNFIDTFVTFDATSVVTWDPDTLFTGGGMFPREPFFVTATGTVDISPYLNYRGMMWEFLGGGGGGAGCGASGGAGSSAVGAGGGAGGYGRCFVNMSTLEAATSDGLIDVTIGAAGAAGASGALGDGGTGGTTIISGDISGTLMQATGGTGGEAISGSANVGIAKGGDGGAASNPGVPGTHLQYFASRGGNGFRGAGGGAMGGYGAPSFYGGITRPNDADGGGNGLAAICFGGGGSGAHDNPSGNVARSGGAGGQGYVIYTPYK